MAFAEVYLGMLLREQPMESKSKSAQGIKPARGV